MIIAAVIGLILAVFFLYRKHRTPDPFEAFEKKKAASQRPTETINIHSMSAELEEFWREKIDDTALKFTVFCDPNISNDLRIEPRSAYNILSMLMTRAHRSTTHGRVHIHITYDEKKSSPPMLSIIAADTGNGDLSPISAIPEQGFRFFDLSTLKDYIGACHGQLDYKVRPNVGAEFIVQLPIEPLFNTQNSPADQIHEKDEKPILILGSDDMIETPATHIAHNDTSLTVLADHCSPANEAVQSTATPSSDPVYESLKGLKVLIVEDKPSNRHALQALLDPLGNHVICVETGQQALDTLQNNIFDYILMDVHMPGLDGIETTKLIRESEVNNIHIPIIALTADTTIKTSNAALSAGVDMVLNKPITASSLFHAILTARTCQTAYQDHKRKTN